MPTNTRQGQIARAIFEVLMDKAEGLPKAQVLEMVKKLITPTRAEQAQPEGILGPWTIGLVKAGWLIKGNGHWSVTESGRAAYFAYPDPESLQHEWNQRYHAWEKKRS